MWLFKLAAVSDDYFLDHTSIVQTKRFHLGDHIHSFLHLPEHHVFAVQPAGKTHTPGGSPPLASCVKFHIEKQTKKKYLPFGFLGADEELGSVGVGPRICH